jgi:tetratricopeptide (TPR) repeat protein
MARCLPGYRFSVGLFPEDWAQVTAQVSFRGSVFGLASCCLNGDGEKAPVDVFNLWPALVESALEKVALRKALVTDAETGLDNGLVFRDRLRRALGGADASPRPLGLWDADQAPSLVLALAEAGGDGPPGARALLAVAGALKSVPEAVCLARLGDRRLGLLFRAPVGEAQARLDQARAMILQNKSSPPLLAGYALHPQDLALDPAGPFFRASEAAEALTSKAATALRFAYGRPQPAPVIGFGQLVASYGRISQVLPQSRVVINLGAPMGALPGQVFSVVGQDGGGRGEITVFETAESFSLAHAPESRPARPAAGDRLVFSRVDWSGHPASFSDNSETLQAENFLQSLIKLAGGGRELVCALARIDDCERLAAVAGDDEVDARVALVLKEARDPSRPAPELSAKWGRGTAALAWTGLGVDAAGAIAGDLIRRLRGRASVSLALVGWPSPVLTPETLMSAARKTLVESAMTGSGVAAVFGPQTLNISGDHLLDEGDLDGAMAEYRRGLLLDPGQLNLLNSLGVCHARLGEHAAAISSFEDVIRLDPGNLMAHFNKGCSLILSGRLEEAEECLAAAKKIAPDNFEVLFHLGRTKLELERPDEALADLARASRLEGHRGAVYRLLGRARLLTSDRDGALEALKKAVKYNPDDPDSLSDLGALFLETANDQEVALSLFQKSVELDPTNSLFRQRLGRLLYQMGDFPSAEHHLKAAVDYGCRAEEVRGQLAELLAKNAAPPEIDPLVAPGGPARGAPESDDADQGDDPGADHDGGEDDDAGDKTPEE